MKSCDRTHSQTADGSSTLYSQRHKALYHSQHGALTESMHVFIDAGFRSVSFEDLSILEIGFGTGLNAALTAEEAKRCGKRVSYHTLELYPLAKDEYELLNYHQFLEKDTADMWTKICDAPWEQEVTINDNFAISKVNQDFIQWIPAQVYNLVYFDAFAPDDQGEMWTEEQFRKLFDALTPNGVLVTYCVKGVVKDTLRRVGFRLERLQGPPGKKHMLRAWKD